MPKTARGFNYVDFKDANGTICNIQESSAVRGEYLIWFGAENIGLKHFKAHEGWTDVELINTMEEHYVANNRTHLTQSQVAELLPILEEFVKTGKVKG